MDEWVASSIDDCEEYPSEVALLDLFRPVGIHELRLIVAHEMLAFPPRLAEQPIFYPVLNRTYAQQIAREWNARRDHFAGYVTAFTIDDAYGSRFPKQIVGAHVHEELWVPAEELATFNTHLIGSISVPEAYFGPAFQGDIPDTGPFSGLQAREQLRFLSERSAMGEELPYYFDRDRITITLHLPYWIALRDAGELSLPEKAMVERVERYSVDLLAFSAGRFLILS